MKIKEVMLGDDRKKRDRHLWEMEDSLLIEELLKAIKKEERS